MQSLRMTRLVVLTGAFVAGLMLSGSAYASPISLPLSEASCGNDRLCYSTGWLTLTTTYDLPTLNEWTTISQDWTITPIQPPDPENWRFAIAAAFFHDSATTRFVYANSGAFGSASLVSAALIDSTGRVLLNTSRYLEPFCEVAPDGPFSDSWQCRNGDSMEARAYFGEYPDPDFDPNLPSLDGPITIRLQWSVYTSEPPVFSELNVNSVMFTYSYAAVPEPTTGLLLMTGLLGLAYQQRRHGRVAGIQAHRKDA